MNSDGTYFFYRTPYVDVLAEHELTALLHSIAYIVYDRDDLELYLRGTIGKKNGPAGGDPGWSLAPPDEKCDLFYACLNADLTYDSDKDIEGYYDEATVKYHMRRAFDKMWELRPERRAEIEAIIQKYAL
jgi:hypothetical protein